MAKEKARYFTFLIYPESVLADWELKLESLGVSMAISPLHDKDLSGVEGQEYKKAHYHVIYVAKNPVTADSVRLKIKRVLGDKSVAKVQIIAHSMENMYLYLTHESKDAVAKKKHKYDKADIKLINNFDIDRYVVFDESEKTEILNLILALIVKFKLQNIIDLNEFVANNGDAYGLPAMNKINDIIAGKTGIIRLYFDGNYQRGQKEAEKDKR